VTAVDLDEMRAWLRDNGVRDGSLHVMPAEQFDRRRALEGHYLLDDGDRWFVFHSERGSRDHETVFDDLGDACLDLLARMIPGAVWSADLHAGRHRKPLPGGPTVDLDLRFSFRVDWSRGDYHAFVGPWMVATARTLFDRELDRYSGSKPRIEQERLILPVELDVSTGVFDRIGRHCGEDWPEYVDGLLAGHDLVHLNAKTYTRKGERELLSLSISPEVPPDADGRDRPSGRITCSARRQSSCAWGETPARVEATWSEYLSEQMHQFQADYGDIARDGVLPAMPRFDENDRPPFQSRLRTFVLRRRLRR
jgi:hypothetical protein